MDDSVAAQPTPPAADMSTHQQADPPTNGGSDESCRPPSSGCWAVFSKFTTALSNFATKVSLKFLKWLASFSLSTLLTFLATFLCWLIYFRPYKLHPQVDLAVLANFNLAPASPAAAGSALLLLYDLTLNMTFVNKHSKCTIHFDHFSTAIYYNGTRIGPSDDTLPRFKLKRWQRRKVYSALRGQASNVSAALAEEFAREREQGQLNVNARVKTTLTYRFFPHRITYYHQYDCWLQFPPVPSDGGAPAVVGGGFKCGIAK